MWFSNKFGFYRQVHIKVPNIKAHGNASNGGRVGTCGQTDGRMDRHDDANSRFSLPCGSVLQINVLNLQRECCLETNYIRGITGHDRQDPEQRTLALRVAAAPYTWETTEGTWCESSDTCI